MLAALAWFESLPPEFVDWDIEKSQDGRETRRQGMVQPQECVSDLGASLVHAVAGLNAKILLE
jgi:hypothetical protein